MVEALQAEWTAKAGEPPPSIPAPQALRLQAALLSEWPQRSDATAAEMEAALDATVAPGVAPPEVLGPRERLAWQAAALAQVSRSQQGSVGETAAPFEVLIRKARAAIDQELTESDAAQVRAVKAEDYLGAALQEAYRDRWRSDAKLRMGPRRD